MTELVYTAIVVELAHQQQVQHNHNRYSIAQGEAPFPFLPQPQSFQKHGKDEKMILIGKVKDPLYFPSS